MNKVNWYIDNYTELGLESLIHGNDNYIVACSNSIEKISKNEELSLSERNAWIDVTNEKIKGYMAENETLKEALEIKRRK